MRMCLGKPVFRSGAPLKVAAAKPISSRRFWGKNSMEGFLVWWDGITVNVSFASEWLSLILVRGWFFATGDAKVPRGNGWTGKFAFAFTCGWFNANQK